MVDEGFLESAKMFLSADVSCCLASKKSCLCSKNTSIVSLISSKSIVLNLINDNVSKVNISFDTRFNTVGLSHIYTILKLNAKVWSILDSLAALSSISKNYFPNNNSLNSSSNI